MSENCRNVGLTPFLYFILLIGPCFFILNAIAQVTQSPTPDKKGISCINEVERSSSDWKTIDLQSFTFRVPNSVEKISVRCDEAGCYQFKNPKFQLNIDINADAYRPTFEKNKYPSYREKVVWISEADGIYALMWSFERPENVNQYQAGVLFTFRDLKNTFVNMNIRSSNQDIAAMAEKIFETVTFKKDARGLLIANSERK